MVQQLGSGNPRVTHYYPGGLARIVDVNPATIQRWVFEDGLITPDGWVENGGETNQLAALFSKERVEQLLPLLRGGKRALIKAQEAGDPRLVRVVSAAELNDINAGVAA